jgi:hypothetical protein
MIKLKLNLFTFSFFILLLSSTFIAYAQDTEKTGSMKVDFIPKPTTQTFPMVYAPEPYGIDAVVSVGPFDNIKVTTVQGFAETDIAVNPRNPLNFVGGDNRAVMSSSNIYYTTDGGNNWSYASTSVSYGDPVFAFDSLGNVDYSVLAPSGVRVWRSSNGGISWTNLGNAFSGSGTDKEWIACDQTGGPYTNHVYLSYSDFSAPVTIRFYRSTNFGASWLGPQSLFGPGNAQGSNIAVGPDGRVFVAWYGSGVVRLVYSTNGGASFGTFIYAAAYTEPGIYNSSFGRYVLKGNIRVNGFPQLASDLTNGPYRGNLYMNYAANPIGPDNADVFLIRSTDGGNTWNTTSPVRVNDDPVGPVKDQWMSDVSVDDQGRVWVMWWDSRNDPSNIMTETYAAVSTDGGVTFLPNIKVSNQPFNPNSIAVSQGSGQAFYLGDYQGMSGKTVTLPLWTDGRQNTRDDYTAQLPDYGIDFTKAIDSLAPGGTRGNTVNVPVMGPFSGTVNFSATVSPPPSTGSITFSWNPSSTLTTFPGSLIINYTVSASVPTGIYNINVTGTESGGIRSHKRSFQLVVTTLVGITGIGGLPKKYDLSQNYPNPFNPSTVLKYSLPVGGLVTLKIFDIAGHEITTLVDEFKNGGKHEVMFDANIENLSSGMYYYRLEVKNSSGFVNFVQTRKMILLK